MSGMIGLEQSDYKAGHGAVLGDYPVRNRLSRGEQIFEGVATVCFTINKTTLIQTPALVDLRNGERPKVVPRIDGRNQRDTGLAWCVWRLAAVKPPPWTKFLENCHNAIRSPPRPESTWRRL